MRALLLVLLLSLPTLAWGEQGHRTVGQVAYDCLTPAARAEVDRLLAAGLPRVRGSFDSLAIACTWPDVVRGGGRLAPYNHPIWHYSSLPFLDGVPDTGQKASGELLTALPAQLAVLSDRRRTRHQRMIALAWVGHLVGDIHQPLHAASRCSAEHPQGDHGGNLFPILGPQYVDYRGQRVPLDELHGYWDQGAGMFLEPMSAQEVGAVAVELERMEPPDSFGPELKDLDPAHWRQESYKLAVGVAYPGIRQGTEPSPNYANFSQQVCRRRLATGGYRLAALLNAALR